MLNLEQGQELVKLARNSIKSYFEGKELKTEKFKEKRGVFVTLLLDNHLRGCIGYPEPVKPLGEATIEVARYAAFEDPRFLPLKKEEFDNIIVEVSILTLPKLIKVKDPKEYVDKIKIGRDGLIIEIPPFRGLLLPQVPIEQNWTKQEFLEQTCLKAGLLANTWKEGDIDLYTFQSQIFKETEPNRKITEESH